MLKNIFFITLIPFISAEIALSSYEMDIGKAPSWILDSEQKKTEVDRWYVDEKTATCKPFKYLGSLGNFNNFVSKAVCENHLTFTPEEKSNSCKLPKSEGKCKTPENLKKLRWYYSANAPSGSNIKNTCHEFNYTGCGGNANNFDSLQECLNTCHNEKNGSVTDDADKNALTKIPNKFDCLFAAEVDNDTPKMGVVLHKNKKRCVYAAVGEEALRGFFDDLPKCVETCITEPVAACNEEGPYQVLPTKVISDENQVQDYYYFDKKNKTCLLFVSKIHEDSFVINDGSKNIFTSAEICASFCPAINHLGDIKAVEACKQDPVGEVENGDLYQLDRYYYKTKGENQNTCQPFKFNGKKMNLNNFKSERACKAICETPLKAQCSPGEKVQVAQSQAGGSVQPVVTEVGDPKASPTGSTTQEGTLGQLFLGLLNKLIS